MSSWEYQLREPPRLHAAGVSPANYAPWTQGVHPNVGATSEGTKLVCSVRADAGKLAGGADQHGHVPSARGPRRRLTRTLRADKMRRLCAAHIATTSSH